MEDSKLSSGDELAIALFCVGAALSLALFLIEKTPVTVVIILTCIAGLIVYPILHVFKRKNYRVVSFVVLVALVAVLGKSAWPHPRIAQDKPPTAPPVVAQDKPPTTPPVVARSEPVTAPQAPGPKPAIPRKTAPRRLPPAQTPAAIAQGTTPSPIPTPSVTNNCPNGICISGGSVDHPEVNNYERPYRHLTEAQKSDIKALADSLPDDSSFLHIEIVNEPEAAKYGNEIADFFRAKTKTIGLGLSYPRGMPEGVYVQIDSDQDPLYPIAKKILHAFASSGIPAQPATFQTPHPGQNTY